MRLPTGVGIEWTLTRRAELYDETFEILDSLTFYNKSIGLPMWPLFEAAYTSFKTGGADYFQGESPLLARKRSC